MDKNNRKLLIFDMDGVVLDSEPLHEIARQEIFRELGIVPDNCFPDPVGGSPSEFWGNVLEKYQIDGSPEDLQRKQYQIVAKQIEENRLQPSEGFLDLVKRAKDRGMKVGLASSSTRMLVDNALRLLGVASFFDVTVSGDEVNSKKPAPDVYLRVLELTDSSPGEAAAIEDSRTGIESAKTAGIFCYGYKNKTSGEQDISKADKIVYHLSEIKV